MSKPEIQVKRPQQSGSPLVPLRPPALSAWWMLIPATVGLVGILTHEWWRDEANTWLVVSASRTFGELIRNLGFKFSKQARDYVGRATFVVILSVDFDFRATEITLSGDHNGQF